MMPTKVLYLFILGTLVISCGARTQHSRRSVNAFYQYGTELKFTLEPRHFSLLGDDAKTLRIQAFLHSGSQLLQEVPDYRFSLQDAPNSASFTIDGLSPGEKLFRLDVLRENDKVLAHSEVFYNVQNGLQTIETLEFQLVPVEIRRRHVDLIVNLTLTDPSSARQVTFLDIKPILASGQGKTGIECLSCHSNEVQKAGLNLQSFPFQSWTKDQRTIVQELLWRIKDQDPKNPNRPNPMGPMPPEERGPRLSADRIAKIEDWLAGGLPEKPIGNIAIDGNISRVTVALQNAAGEKYGVDLVRQGSSNKFTATGPEMQIADSCKVTVTVYGANNSILHRSNERRWVVPEQGPFTEDIVVAISGL